MNARARFSTVLILLVAAVGAMPLHAQTSNGSANASTTTPAAGASSSGTSASGTSTASVPHAAAVFEMPRIKANRRSDDTQSVPKEHASVHPLTPNGSTGAHGRSKQNINYIEVDSRTTWSSPLRGAAKDTTFVSFFVYASDGTSIDIGGAKLLVHGSKKEGYLQMQIGRSTDKGVQWRDFGGPIKVEKYDNSRLAALPVLTARLDPVAGIWDLYVGQRLGAADIPLKALPAGASRQFAVHAGTTGAFVCGVISSDDNPLYQDENRNGIDDVFERAQNRGYLLTAPGLARTQLAQKWQQDQQGRQTQFLPWAVQRPQPDGVPAKPPGR